MKGKIEARILKDFSNIFRKLEITDIRVEVREDGWYVAAVDPYNVRLCEILLGRDAWEEYGFTEKTFAIDVDRLYKFASDFKKGEIVEIAFEDTRELEATFYLDGTLARTFTLLDEESLRTVKIPELEYKVELTLLAPQIKLIKDILGTKLGKEWGNEIGIGVVERTPGEFELCAYASDDEGVKGKACVPLERATNYLVIEECAAVYSFDYFKSIFTLLTKEVAATETVTIQFAFEYPLKISYERKGLEVMILLAPRIDEEKKLAERDVLEELRTPFKPIEEEEVEVEIETTATTLYFIPTAKGRLLKPFRRTEYSDVELVDILLEIPFSEVEGILSHLKLEAIWKETSYGKYGGFVKEEGLSREPADIEAIIKIVENYDLIETPYLQIREYYKHPEQLEKGKMELKERVSVLIRYHFGGFGARMYALSGYLTILADPTFSEEEKESAKENAPKMFAWIKRKYDQIPFSELSKSPFYDDLKPLFEINELLSTLEGELERKPLDSDKIESIMDSLGELGKEYGETVDKYYKELTGKDLGSESIETRALLEYRSKEQIEDQARWLQEQGIEPNSFEKAAMDYYGVEVPEEEPPWRRLMDVIKELEKEHGLEVPEDIAIAAATEVGIERTEDLIGELKRDGILYSPAKGLIARVEREKPEPPAKEPWMMTREEWIRKHIKNVDKLDKWIKQAELGETVEVSTTEIDESFPVGRVLIYGNIASTFPSTFDETSKTIYINIDNPSDFIVELLNIKDRAIQVYYALLHEVEHLKWAIEGKTLNPYSPETQYEKYHSHPSEVAAREASDAFFRSLLDAHRKAIHEALREGKPIPEEVLKDYPDLIKKPPEEETEPIPPIPTNLIPYEEALRAYEGISHTPERSAEVVINDFYNSIRSIYDELSKYAETETQKSTLDYYIKEFAEEYATRYRAILRQKAGLISPMVAGPSKFPAERMRKLSEKVDKREREFSDWIEKQKKRIKKDIEEVGIEEEGGEVAHLRNEIAKLNEKLERMKAINKVVKSKSLSDTEKRDKLAEMGYSQPEIEKLLTPDYMGQLGLPDYTLTSIRSKIKTREERIETLTKKEEKKKRGEEIIYERYGLKIVENPDVDRYQLLFEEKPDKALRDELKKKGFKWSPTNKAWQRMVTSEALYVIKNQIIPQWEEKEVPVEYKEGEIVHYEPYDKLASPLTGEIIEINRTKKGIRYTIKDAEDETYDIYDYKGEITSVREKPVEEKTLSVSELKQKYLAIPWNQFVDDVFQGKVPVEPCVEYVDLPHLLVHKITVGPAEEVKYGAVWDVRSYDKEGNILVEKGFKTKREAFLDFHSYIRDLIKQEQEREETLEERVLRELRTKYRFSRPEADKVRVAIENYRQQHNKKYVEAILEPVRDGKYIADDLIAMVGKEEAKEKPPEAKTEREKWVLQTPSQQYIQDEMPKTIEELKDDLVLFQERRQYWITHKKGVKPESRAVAIRDLNEKIEAIESELAKLEIPEEKWENVTKEKLEETRRTSKFSEKYAISQAKAGKKVSATEETVYEKLPDELDLGPYSDVLLYTPVEEIRYLSKAERAAFIKLVDRGWFQVYRVSKLVSDKYPSGFTYVLKKTREEEKPPEKEILFYKYVKKELDEGAIVYTSYPTPVSEILIAQLPDGRWNVHPDPPLFPEKSFRERTEALEYAETNIERIVEEETGKTPEEFEEKLLEKVDKDKAEIEKRIRPLKPSISGAEREIDECDKGLETCLEFCDDDLEACYEECVEKEESEDIVECNKRCEEKRDECHDKCEEDALTCYDDSAREIIGMDIEEGDLTKAEEDLETFMDYISDELYEELNKRIGREKPAWEEPPGKPPVVLHECVYKDEVIEKLKTKEWEEREGYAINKEHTSLFLYDKDAALKPLPFLPEYETAEFFTLLKAPYKEWRHVEFIPYKDYGLDHALIIELIRILYGGFSGEVMGKIITGFLPTAKPIIVHIPYKDDCAVFIIAPLVEREFEETEIYGEKHELDYTTGDKPTYYDLERQIFGFYVEDKIISIDEYREQVRAEIKPPEIPEVKIEEEEQEVKELQEKVIEFKKRIREVELTQGDYRRIENEIKSLEEELKYHNNEIKRVEAKIQKEQAGEDVRFTEREKYIVENLKRYKQRQKEYAALLHEVEDVYDRLKDKYIETFYDEPDKVIAEFLGVAVADVKDRRRYLKIAEALTPKIPPEKVKIHGIFKTRYRCPICYRAAPENFCIVHSDVEAIDLLAADEPVKEDVIDLTFLDLFKTKYPEKKRWTVEELHEAIGIDVDYAPEFLGKQRPAETYAEYYARELGVEIEGVKKIVPPPPPAFEERVVKEKEEVERIMEEREKVRDIKETIDAFILRHKEMLHPEEFLAHAEDVLALIPELPEPEREYYKHKMGAMVTLAEEVAPKKMIIKPEEVDLIKEDYSKFLVEGNYPVAAFVDYVLSHRGERMHTAVVEILESLEEVGYDKEKINIIKGWFTKEK